MHQQQRPHFWHARRVGSPRCWIMLLGELAPSSALSVICTAVTKKTKNAFPAVVIASRGTLHVSTIGACHVNRLHLSSLLIGGETELGGGQGPEPRSVDVTLVHEDILTLFIISAMNPYPFSTLNHLHFPDLGRPPPAWCREDARKPMPHEPWRQRQVTDKPREATIPKQTTLLSIFL